VSSENYILTLEGETWRGRTDISAPDYVKDKEKVRRDLGISTGREVPQGGIAKWLHDEAPLRKKLGNLQFACQLLKDSIVLQEFEHGILIGPFRLRTKDSNEDGRVIVLLFDGSNSRSGKWRQTQGTLTASQCYLPVWG
jgi:hypothetical protein